MSFSWYFHSFNSQDLENKILKGHGIYTGSVANNIKIQEELRIAEFNYSKLPEQYWNYLDHYLTTSILDLNETKQVSPDHAHWRVWTELSGLDTAEPTEIFDALSSAGRRYNCTEKKKSFFSKLKSIYNGFKGKNNPDYIIIKDAELRLFILSLEKIFESTEASFFEDFGGKEELKPYFLDPFVRAFEEEKAVLGILT
jgi:hypothetical protein